MKGICNHIIQTGKFKGKKYCEVYKGFKECCPGRLSLYTEDKVKKKLIAFGNALLVEEEETVNVLAQNFIKDWWPKNR